MAQASSISVDGRRESDSRPNRELEETGHRVRSQDGEVLRQLLKRGRERDLTATGKDWATRLA